MATVVSEPGESSGSKRRRRRARRDAQAELDENGQNGNHGHNGADHVLEGGAAVALIEPADRELTVHCRRHAFDDAEVTVAVHPVGERFDFAVAGRPRTEFPGTVTLVMTPKLAGALR